MPPSEIRCTGIRYRQGYVEVLPNIHEGYINLETWNIHPDMDISGPSCAIKSIPEDGFVGNTEIELSIHEAEALVQLLQSAINIAKSGR